MTGRGLYFVAIVLPEPIASEIRTLQGVMSDHYQSHAALRSPPHITLVPPFAASQGDVETLVGALQTGLAGISSVHVVLNGFGKFGNRVIYVHVDPSSVLSELALALSTTLRNEGVKLRDERRAYHPHVTLAYKDLKASVFAEAWAYCSGITLAFTVEVKEIVLLEHRDGRWVEAYSMPFCG